MIKGLLAILLMISISPAFAQLNPNNNFVDEYLNNVNSYKVSLNKIKQSTITNYDVKFGAIEKTGRVKEVNKYNEQGQLITQVRYSYPDSASTTYSYNLAGDLVQALTVYSVNKAEVKYIYKYDTCHNVIELRQFDNDRLLPPSKMKYDDSDNRIEFMSYNEDGSLLYKILYKYDKLNRRLEEVRYDPKGANLNRTAYKYYANGTIGVFFYTINASCSGCYKSYITDAQNRLIKVRDFGINGAPEDYSLFTYDEDGFLVEKTTYNPINEPLGVERVTYTKYTPPTPVINNVDTPH